MTGHVDESGAACVELSLFPQPRSDGVEQIVGIDTGFNGELLLTSHLIREMNLAPQGVSPVILASGKSLLLKTYRCWIEWFGVRRMVVVIETEYSMSFIGTSLLAQRRLVIDYRTELVAID